MRNSTTIQDIRNLLARVQSKNSFTSSSPKIEVVINHIRDFMEMFEHAFSRLENVEEKVKRISDLEKDMRKLQRQFDAAKILSANKHAKD